MSVRDLFYRVAGIDPPARAGQEPEDAKASPWEVPAENTFDSPPGPRSPGLPGVQLAQERPAAKAGRQIMRVLVAAACLVLILAGLRSLTRSTPKPPEPTLPASISFDQGGAQMVAARWARNYLTVVPSEAGAKARTEALAKDAATDVDTAAGLSARAPQRVVALVPGTVEVREGGKAATVTVLATVETTEGTGKAPKIKQHDIAMAVPVAPSGSRMVVTARGAFVGLPAPGKSPLPGEQVDPDGQMSEDTRGGALAWFRAFGGSDANALASVSAPGASITPLGGYGLVSLDQWRVAKGDGDTRRARATVTWSTPAGTVQQTYSLTLTRTSAGSNTAWPVSTITTATQGATQ